MLQKGDVVRARGKLKKIADFVASLDKEDLRILASFFEGDAKGPADAKKLKKPLVINNFYNAGAEIEVRLSKEDLWSDKLEYWEKVEGDEEGSPVLPVDKKPLEPTGAISEKMTN